MQYSGAQNIIPISKDIILTPEEEPEVQGEEPEVEVEEPEVQGEDEGPPGRGGQPEVQGEDDLTNKDDETQSEEQPESTDPRKGVQGGLDITNQSQEILPPAFKIKIIFDAIKLKNAQNQECHDLDMGMYVQGKLVRLSNINEPLRLCGDTVEQIKNAEVTIEIPGEPVESIKDYQPFSIFSAGSELDNCIPKPLPTDLPEIREFLADKGLSRPYYADARENIRQAQLEISNGCIPKYGYNQSLAWLNYIFESPGYGKVVPEDTVGNPERVQIDSCRTYALALSHHYETRHFCLYYTIECPLCAAIRVQ